MFDEVVAPVRPHVAGRALLLRGPLLLHARAQRAARSRTPSPTRPCGWPPATPAPSRRRPAWASASCASPSGSPSQLAPLIEVYKKTIEKAEPVGGYVNDNVMVTTQMLCLEDGQRARQIACDMASSYHQSLVFRYLDTFPKPPVIPTWPEVLPEPTLEEMDARIAKGLVAVGTPDECIKNVPDATPTSAPTSSPSACSRPPCPSRPASRPSRPSAATSSPPSTRTRCTAPPATARPPSPSAPR